MGQKEMAITHGSDNGKQSLSKQEVRNEYVREFDGATMIEIAPHQYLNEKAARALGYMR